MKKIVVGLLLGIGFIGNAQTNTDLIKHYEAFYKEMRAQGDAVGVINALTHLNVLSPSKERKDTLAYLYVGNNQHLQALNTIGIEKKADDSDLAVQVKAISLKALGETKRAIEHFEVLNKRGPNPYIAYELADLKIQTGNSTGAMTNIDYGMANAKDDMKFAFHERQQPYEVPLKAAFLHLKALVKYNDDQANPDPALVIIEEALTLAPNFYLASLSKQAITARKEQQTKAADAEGEAPKN